MTLMERQDKIREKFIKDWLNEELVSANFNNRELVFNTGDKEFPYIRLTIAALNDEQGDEKIIELIEKQNTYEDILNKRRIKKVFEMLNIKQRESAIFLIMCKLNGPAGLFNIKLKRTAKPFS